MLFMDTQEKRERTATTIRRINAAIAACLVIFFFVHAALGALSEITGHTSNLKWIVWIFAALVVVHMSLTLATSYYMVTDTVRPPSKAKIRHLALKWASGMLLLVLAFMHMLRIADLGIPLMITLLGVIAWHSFIGAKSLTRDLNLPRTIRTPLRVCVIAVAVAIAGIVIYGVIT